MVFRRQFRGLLCRPVKPGDLLILNAALDLEGCGGRSDSLPTDMHGNGPRIAGATATRARRPTPRPRSMAAPAEAILPAAGGPGTAFRMTSAPPDAGRCPPGAASTVSVWPERLPLESLRAWYAMQVQILLLSPSNNHSFILYFIYMRWLLIGRFCLVRRRESLYSLFRRINSLF